MKPLFHTTFLVGVGNVVATLCTIVTLRIYADRFGPSDISAVLIFRLYGSLLVACAALGMPIALQRTVAFLGATPSRADWIKSGSLD